MSKSSNISDNRRHVWLECAICQDKPLVECSPVAVVPCGHVFHDHCLKLWTVSKQDCPYCKSPVEKQIGIFVNEDYLEDYSHNVEIERASILKRLRTSIKDKNESILKYSKQLISQNQAMEKKEAEFCTQRKTSSMNKRELVLARRDITRLEKKLKFSEDRFQVLAKKYKTVVKENRKVSEVSEQYFDNLAQVREYSNRAVLGLETSVGSTDDDNPNINVTDCFTINSPEPTKRRQFRNSTISKAAVYNFGDSSDEELQNDSWQKLYNKQSSGIPECDFGDDSSNDGSLPELESN